MDIAVGSSVHNYHRVLDLDYYVTVVCRLAICFHSQLCHSLACAAGAAIMW